MNALKTKLWGEGYKKRGIEGVNTFEIKLRVINIDLEPR